MEEQMLHMEMNNKESRNKKCHAPFIGLISSQVDFLLLYFDKSWISCTYLLMLPLLVSLWRQCCKQIGLTSFTNSPDHNDISATELYIRTFFFCCKDVLNWSKMSVYTFMTVYISNCSWAANQQISILEWFLKDNVTQKIAVMMLKI